MGINGIFALFGFSGEDENPKENVKIKEEINAYKKTPYFKMGMLKAPHFIFQPIHFLKKYLAVFFIS